MTNVSSARPPVCWPSEIEVASRHADEHHPTSTGCASRALGRPETSHGRTRRRLRCDVDGVRVMNIDSGTWFTIAVIVGFVALLLSVYIGARRFAAKQRELGRWDQFGPLEETE